VIEQRCHPGDDIEYVEAPVGHHVSAEKPKKARVRTEVAKQAADDRWHGDSAMLGGRRGPPSIGAEQEPKERSRTAVVKQAGVGGTEDPRRRAIETDQSIARRPTGASKL